MVYQTVHGKPIMSGHVSRLPQEAFAFLDSVPFLEPLNFDLHLGRGRGILG